MSAVFRGLVLGLVIALALWHPSPAQVGPGQISPTQSSPLNLLLTVDRFAYRPGEPITFTLRVQNVSDQAIAIPFPTAQRFDVIIQSEFAEVDRWSNDRAIAQASGEQHWAPGEVIIYTDTWLPTSALLPGAAGGAPQPLTRGLFQLYAEVATVTLRAVSPPVPIIIGSPYFLPGGCTELPDLPTSDLPADALARAVEPRDALQSFWQATRGNGPLAAYSPDLPLVSNLPSLHQRAPITVCVNQPAQIMLP